MIRINLPRGLKYRIEKANPGVITPGSDNDPLITIYGSGIYRQYRLISFTEVEETYEGNLTEDEIAEIEDELWEMRPKLLIEAKVRHYVKFVDDSPCYYDFHSEKLYGASGVREKKGPIKGESFRPSTNVRDFIEIMTEVPGTKTNVIDILEKNQNSDKSFATIWMNFLKLDASIRSTFLKVRRGICIYEGNAPTWQVGGEIGATDITLGAIFSGITYRKIVATFDKERRKLNASLLDDIEPESILAFLGLDSDVFDSSFVNIEKLITKNYIDSTDRIESLLAKYTSFLEGVWNHLINNIETSFSYTFSASSYYEETLNIPMRDSDLISYVIPARSPRWNNALERACLSVKNIIQSTRVGVDYFMHCKKEVNADSVIDYIAALVLISFSYCKTPTNSEKTREIKGRYKKRLLDFIQEKFGYIPPSNSGDSLFDPEALQMGLQRLLTFREQLLSDGQYAYASEIEKIFDGLNLGYNDENSLIPPPRGREH